MLQKIIGSIVLVCISFLAFSQEQLGLRLSNYSGINGTFFNPASNVNSPLAWDINVIAAGAFAENNYAFIKDASMLKVIRNHYGFMLASTGDPEVNASGRLQYDFTNGKRRKEGYVNTFVTGPSAMFHIKQYMFGVFFNMRSTISANRVSASLGYYDIYDLKASEVLHVKPFKAAGMVWSEVGFNYGRRVYHNNKHTINGGVSLKFLQGYEAFYFQNHEPMDVTLHADTSFYPQANVTFGLASGALNISPQNPYGLKARGYGASIDIGAVYYMQGNKHRPFDWKIGLSLLDFGRINFTKDAQAHEIKTHNDFDVIKSQYANIQNAEDAFQVLSVQSLLNASASKVADQFNIRTPAGISAFAERAITDHFFINAAVVRRLRFKGAVPERDNIWSITPRYEKRWFEVSIPLVLYNDKKLRMGTAVRLGPLVVGSDNLTSWFGSHNISGSDIYFALKLNPMSLGLKRQQHDRTSQFPDG